MKEGMCECMCECEYMCECEKVLPDAVLVDVDALNGANTRDLVGLEVGWRVG